ncbi:MAG: hypothetical protein WCJ07_09275 [Verrucomicrobiota bacterium]
MSKTATMTISLVALLIGIVVGGWTTKNFRQYYNTRSIIGQLNGEACSTVFTLQHLRSGYITNAVEFLEKKLDGELIGFSGIMLAEPRLLKSDPSFLTTLNVITEYRTHYPQKSGSPEIDAQADKAIDLLNEQTKH